jgi:hypothetical protein
MDWKLLKKYASDDDKYCIRFSPGFNDLGFSSKTQWRAFKKALLNPDFINNIILKKKDSYDTSKLQSAFIDLLLEVNSELDDKISLLGNGVNINFYSFEEQGFDKFSDAVVYLNDKLHSYEMNVLRFKL